MKSIRIQPLEKPITASVAIPGSKSYTNRALLLAALTSGVVRLKNPLVSDDTHAMIACLRELGMRCSFTDDFLEVRGDIRAGADREYHLNANFSGTTIRFILALAAIVPGIKVIRGRGRLNERPIAHLVESLRELGAEIVYVDTAGYPPIKVMSSKLSPGTVHMKGTISSQFLSALLMVAPLIGEVRIEVEGEQVSRPYIDMTIEAMEKFGVKVSNENYERYIVPSGQTYSATEYTVEGDISSASYFAAIATLTRSKITLTNVNPNTVQADIGFFNILKQMGSTIEEGENSMTIQGAGVKPLTVDMQDCPDQAQTLAVLAAFADGTTTITGVQTLRIKETERVEALEKELEKMGVKTESTPDTLVIHGGHPKPARIDTYGDHRMAMSFAVAATQLAGIEINDPDVVSKTFPRFWKTLGLMGVPFDVAYEDPNIVLIGMRGGGKTTAGKILAEKMGKEYADVDELIEAREGMKIAETVEKRGWEYFRDRESEVVEEVAKRKGLIVSTGGGVIQRPQNIAALKENGILVFLNAPADVLASRVGEDPNRPALTDAPSMEAEMEEVLSERKKLYEAAADIIIQDVDLTLEQKVAEVQKQLEKRHIL